MFQNITDEVEEKIKIKNNIRASKILKELFAFRNIFIYILTFYKYNINSVC